MRKASIPNQKILYIGRYTIKLFIDIVKMVLGVAIQKLIPNIHQRPIFGRHKPIPLKQMGLVESQGFVQINDAGFGDRWNTWIWSMKLWRGKLYAGTNRAFPCVAQFVIHSSIPRLVKYPHRSEPDIKCTASPYDLPLQAEIWCYTPETQTWERVYQSPKEVDVPSQPGKRVARDFGFRNMLVFNESDGKEALYVSGVSTRGIDTTYLSKMKGLYQDVSGILTRKIDGAFPPPRLLRSTDGVSFESIPCEPGTVMGDLSALSFRALTSYKERMYVAAGALMGWGIVLESDNPKLGNNHFKQVSPPGMRVFEMIPFNGYLYLGLLDYEKGYSVVKTDAKGTPPYNYTQVVPYSGGRRRRRSYCASSMFVFQGNMYVGTDSPAEVIRIYPDDRWDLIVGNPRRTPEGVKRPLSGIGDGFDNGLNRTIQRMEEHNGWLYVSTVKYFATKLRKFPIVGPWFKEHAGFDLYATRDGENFVCVTDNGFRDACNTFGRTLVSTPVGLFVGVANEHKGAKVYLGKESTP